MSFFKSLAARSRERLEREYNDFKPAWDAASTKANPASGAWVDTGKLYLDRVEQYLKQGGDLQAAWVNLEAARRQEVFGLAPPQLEDRARILREESRKIRSWRAGAIRGLIEDCRTLTADRVAKAMEVRDGYSQNQYHRTILATDQFKVLLALAGAALLGFVAVWTSPLPEETDLLHPRLLGAVLLMGLLGGACSSAYTLFRQGTKGTIPERMLQWWVTVVRTLFGAAAGLLAFLAYESSLLPIKMGDNQNQTATDLVIAFVGGYLGERLVSKIAGRAIGEDE